MKKYLSILIWVLMLSTGLSLAQTVNYQFARYDVMSGLSHNQVNCFLKDQKGFMWIGTAGGLNRFDGYTYRIFRHHPQDVSSIRDNQINSIFEDPQGYIWIHTRQGYSIYNPNLDRIENNTSLAAKRLGLPDDDFTKVMKGKDGDYWIAHNRMGLIRYKPSMQKLTQISTALLEDQAGFATAQGVVSDFQENSKGDLWMVFENGSIGFVKAASDRISKISNLFQKQNSGTTINHRIFVDQDDEPWLYTIKNTRGIFYYDLAKEKLIAGHTKSADYRLTNNIISAMIHGSDGKIWIGTDHGGINVMDKKLKTVHALTHNPDNTKSISQNSITNLYKDPMGMIWVGTFKKGFLNYHPRIFKFSLIQHEPLNAKSLPFGDVNVFAEDKKGNLWVGTNGGGLIYYDRKLETFKQYLNDPADPQSLSNNIIVSMYIDQQDQLWIGTYFGGLNRFDGNKFQRFINNPNDNKSLIDDRVWEIYEDKSKRLWIGTLDSGLDLFDRRNGVFIHHRPTDLNSINSQYISALMEDREGNIWIGTTGGVNVLEKRSGQFKIHKHIPGNHHSLSDNTIISLAEDGLGNVWVGTSQGLNLYNKSNGKFSVFNSGDGFPDNSILTIVVDAQDNLWLGTPKGLVHMNIKEREGILPLKYDLRVFNQADGLQGSSFNENAALCLRSGELVFGGAYGFAIFTPEKVMVDDGQPPVVLTDFQIFNKSIQPGKNSDGHTVMDQSISETELVKLKYGQNVFTIEFAALNFLEAEKNHYLYTLEGFNDRWFEADNLTRKVTYTNLDPGHYTFKVRMKDRPGDLRTLKIEIAPPFWRTYWAYLFYLLLILGALWLARWILLERERMNFKLEQERKDAQQLHEFDLMRIKFYTNVSHEFRTPLTLILTPLESLIGSLHHETGIQNQLKLIQRNGKRLLNLVNQLLDFKKLEIQETTLQAERNDIIPVLQDISNTFKDISTKKNIEFVFESNVSNCVLDFDREKFSRIMFNLLSNAFKFTPNFGKVRVRTSIRISDEATQLEILVEDTGIGISEDALSKVFDRFYQENLPSHLINDGSGIGLSITKEFVKLHQGVISVESTLGKGSTFKILLPIAAGPDPEHNEIEKKWVDGAQETDTTSNEKEIINKPVLLLVEDNEDFREYLREMLAKEYFILEATNGKLGLETVLDSIPDLIVSDVMMPEMDGIEFCRIVKSDHRTSHIPFLLLTSRAEEVQQLQGYETGADGYVTKPFRMDILRARIRNLINLRKSFQAQFGRRKNIETSEIVINSLDDQFLKKSVLVVETNIANPDFTVEELSREMAMSRMYLYKKILALTGKPPLEFIRTIRMQRAAGLLEKSQLSISEIAYQVGFNNPKYFAKLFKEEYQMLPTEYRRQSIHITLYE